MRKLGVLSILFAALAGCTSTLAVEAEMDAFAERPCAEAVAAGGGRCGIVSVLENREAGRGRRIDLNVIVLPATERPSLSPVFDIDGGPGLPATKNAEFYLTYGSAYRASRDIVLVDQRGTGASNGLHCPELSNAAKPYEPMFPAAAVSKCRERLSAVADLKQYTTEAAVADLDAVRAALGYERIDFVGLSYGTLVALRYIAKHPDRVRAAVLFSTAPPSAMPPRYHATAGQRALDLVLADCKADAACAQAFPDLELTMNAAKSRLAGGEPGIRPEIFAEKIRSLMYSPIGARQVPFVLSRAAEGDFEPFRALTGNSSPYLIADGMFLSVTCAEGLALLPADQASEEAKRTVFGDYRLRRQSAACAEWPTAKVTGAFLEPIAADTAVLFVSGRLDPVTPPDWAEKLRGGLRNSRHIVLAHSGHIFDGLSGIEECLDPLIRDFLVYAQPGRVDDACTKDMTPPPFRTE